MIPPSHRVAEVHARINCNANWIVFIGQRLRDVKNNAKRTSRRVETPEVAGAQAEFHDAVPSADSNLVFHDIVEPSPPTDGYSESTDITLAPFDLGNISVCPFSQTPTASPTAQPRFPMTVFSALYLNGRILGLSCSTTVPARSSLPSPQVPLPLHPTPMQLMTIHASWIDRFPLSTMRNNLITMSGMMDEEEFLSDVFMGPSFTIKPGCATWDPRAWRMEKCFADKWGYLFL
ncbi:hypothetical protein BCR34DRAFT_368894 [Clohesyomyces aquaticus]|uniref:Uncharacterized protein n=1 Tax=Clohesyomyces aquaticus TaxID=1231657 RepID=A0A1Y1ZGV3_9PLEO|nr:hypothetical protein BCR34DRAFT_368894 [Clohesyomyces aquaticus]